MQPALRQIKVALRPDLPVATERPTVEIYKAIADGVEADLPRRPNLRLSGGQRDAEALPAKQRIAASSRIAGKRRLLPG